MIRTIYFPLSTGFANFLKKCKLHDSLFAIVQLNTVALLIKTCISELFHDVTSFCLAINI